LVRLVIKLAVVKLLRKIVITIIDLKTDLIQMHHLVVLKMLKALLNSDGNLNIYQGSEVVEVQARVILFFLLQGLTDPFARAITRQELDYYFD
jgi:hypothetical protein